MNAVHTPQRYYLAPPSYWPITGSIALFTLVAGFALLINGVAAGAYVMVAGALILAAMLVGWFGTVIAENQKGLFNKRVDLSFRWGMSWFIFSEVMFFAAFFGALFYIRNLALPMLGEGQTVRLLWPHFVPAWPTAGPGLAQRFTPMQAWGIPAVNTLVLLSSGATVTWAHWGLKRNNRRQLIVGLALTVLLGLSFLGLQAHEYWNAYHHLGLTLGAGVYGATFFLLTGFHGAHVTVGTIMLLVILARAVKGHFDPEHHFGFEAVTWYWHFVDVVWLLLFIFVYWL
ncbi:MAG: cytochrome c oxidase subunit 3 [Betaproteobacteria bacterium]|nr:cytochrome c oxidase subunit 3 [Betaproteobacteria bacterium]